MDKPVTKENIENILKDMFQSPAQNRNIKVWTNARGFDMFDEIIGDQVGFYRIYLGRKVLRLLRRGRTEIRKSADGRYYKQLKKQ